MEQKYKYWINNLALEAENAVTLLPSGEQEYTRYHIVKNIKKLLTKQNQHNGQNSKMGKEDLRIINQIKDKLHKNKAMVTKGDKGSSIVVIYCDKYEHKVNNFISNNEAIETNDNVTVKFKKDVGITLNECRYIIDTNNKWRYINLNPSTPVMRGLVKIH